MAIRSPWIVVCVHVILASLVWLAMWNVVHKALAAANLVIRVLIATNSIAHMIALVLVHASIVMKRKVLCVNVTRALVEQIALNWYVLANPCARTKASVFCCKGQQVLLVHATLSPQQVLRATLALILTLDPIAHRVYLMCRFQHHLHLDLVLSAVRSSLVVRLNIQLSFKSSTTLKILPLLLLLLL